MRRNILSVNLNLVEPPVQRCYLASAIQHTSNGIIGNIQTITTRILAKSHRQASDVHRLKINQTA